MRQAINEAMMVERTKIVEEPNDKIGETMDKRMRHAEGDEERRNEPWNREEGVRSLMSL